MRIERRFDLGCLTRVTVFWFLNSRIRSANFGFAN
uniref:Uncharacterized protein n=1 Tax=Arundo donax TaxID=35708 RepID=A0A0A9GJ35_ARUDO